MSSRLRPGLVSVTLRALSPDQIIALAIQAELQTIEWGGDVHVPPGDAQRAVEVGQRTRDAGLSVAAYGSYYRLGQAAEADFAAILEAALALQAPLIRVWAGTESPQNTEAKMRQRIIEDARRCAEMGAQVGVKVALEFHRGTLTESAGSALRFMTQVDHPNLRALWQPIYWLSHSPNAVTQSNAEDLGRLKPYLENVHIFQWSEDAAEGAQEKATRRWPLAAGATAWREYLSILNEPAENAAEGREHYALLEFVRDDDPRALLEDAATLRGWLRAL